jgi:hypothetical protein
VPATLASSTIGRTVFTLEESLSSRDGRTVDDGSRVEVMNKSLAVIAEFHRLTSTRQLIDADVLATFIRRPIELVRSCVSPGTGRFRHRALDALSDRLNTALSGQSLEVGWIHGDFHLGNILIDDAGTKVVGVIDWGRACPRGLPFLDGFTMVLMTTAYQRGREIGEYVLELVRAARSPAADSANGAVLMQLRAILGDTPVEVSNALLLTWLSHIANNLKNEDRTRAHMLWSARNIDLLLFGLLADAPS